MPIRILPNQIPSMWEPIKYAAVVSSAVEEEYIPLYLTRTLHMLLGGKAQCHARLDEERRLIRLAITKLKVNEFSGEKSLEVSCLYGFKPTPLEDWLEDLEFLKDMARKYGCKSVTFHSNSDKVFEIAKNIGFKQHFRCYIKEV